MINAKTKICMIIGDPVSHSLSPTMHNTAYKELGIEDDFVFLASNIKIEDVGKTADAVRLLGIRGLTCTIPHKVEILKYLDQIDETAKKIGAVNTVVNENGVLKGYNTDWLGATIPLEKLTKLENKKVALVGAGGAARAIAFGLTQKGCKLKIWDLDLDLAKNLASETSSEFKTQKELEEIKDCDIVINATPLGMHPHQDKTAIPKEFLHKDQIAFDIVYTPYETKFLKEAKEKNCQIIHGLEMLLYQGTAQFELYTGQKAPENAMQKVLEENLGL